MKRLCTSCNRNQAKQGLQVCGACERSFYESSREEAFTQLVYKLAEAAAEANLNGMGETIEQLLTEARGY